jgi:hypothetical protein
LNANLGSFFGVAVAAAEGSGAGVVDAVGLEVALEGLDCAGCCCCCCGC